MGASLTLQCCVLVTLVQKPSYFPDDWTKITGGVLGGGGGGIPDATVLPLEEKKVFVWAPTLKFTYVRVCVGGGGAGGGHESCVYTSPEDEDQRSRGQPLGEL